MTADAIGLAGRQSGPDESLEPSERRPRAVLGSEAEPTGREEPRADLAEMRARFVARVARELRTPLSCMVGLTELLLDEAVEPLAEAQRGYVRGIERNAGRLLHLVDDLLTLVRLESGMPPLQVRTVDAAEVVRTAVARLRADADRRGVKVSIAGPAHLPVRTDPGHLAQVLDNLIGNAVKFSRSGGRVRVEVDASDPRVWRLAVADEGIGIPPDDRRRLFQTFHRAGNARHAAPGNGLGLAITRTIVERHGGRIEVDSVEGEGTTVTVSLGRTERGDPGASGAARAEGDVS